MPRLHVSELRRQASSQDYDGGVARPRGIRPLGLTGRPAAVTLLPPRALHGVGARSHLHYCDCGAKKVKGICPRC